MYEIKITASTLPELASAILAVAENYRTIPAGGTITDAAPAEDKPKRTRAKAEPAGDAAPATSKLEPVEEASEQRREGVSDTASKVEATEPKVVEDTSGNVSIAGPTRDDALTAATKFSQLSAAQGGGSDALADVLKHFNVERFSALTEDQYGDFISEMKKRQDAAAAASSALS